MKKGKKILAVLLAMAMVMGMSLTAFAAPVTKETATITIKDEDGKLLKAEDVEMKYVQVIKPDTTTITGWAFTSADIENDYLAAFKLTKGQEVIAKLTANTATADEIAQALSNVAGDAKVTFEPMANSQTVNQAGVYAIKAIDKLKEGETDKFTYNNMTAYIGFGTLEIDGTEYAYPSLVDAELTAKRAPISVEKVITDEDAVVAVGDTVTYKITATVPYMNPNDTDKTFYIYDNISGAVYDLKGATIKDGNTAVEGASIVLNDAKTGFSIDLGSLINNSNSNAGHQIVVTYNAVVTATTVGNEAHAGHKGGSQFGSTPNVPTYTGKITLTKTDATDTNMKLAAAGFHVTKKDSTTLLTFVLSSDGVYKYDPNGTITEVVTREDGTVTVEGLDLGTYTFTEVTAPEGYSVNATPVEAVLTLAEGTKVATATITQEASMKDTKLSSLPATGGIGTTIFTIGGCIIMVAAAGLFFASRKKSSNTK